MGWFERGQVVGRLAQTDIAQQAEIDQLRADFAAYQASNAPAIAYAEARRTRRSHVWSWVTAIITGIRSRVAIAIYTAAATYLASQVLHHLQFPHIHW